MNMDTSLIHLDAADKELIAASRSDLVEESRSRQNHGELTRVVGVVEPGLMVDVPRVISPREADDTISGLAPHSEGPQRAQSTQCFLPIPR